MSDYSIQTLATQYANRIVLDVQRGQQLAPAVRDLRLKRHMVDFQVIGFNLATALTVATFALTVFTGSPVMAIFAFLSYQTRQAFMKSINRLGADNDVVGLAPEIEFDAERLNTHLGIRDQNIQWIALQIFGFRAYMTRPPLLEGEENEPLPVRNPRPVQNRGEEAPVNDAPNLPPANANRAEERALPAQNQGGQEQAAALNPNNLLNPEEEVENGEEPFDHVNLPENEAADNDRPNNT